MHRSDFYAQAAQGKIHMKQWTESAPIVIGGVGGSGTRAIAAILIKAGYFLGDDLNEALDNLWFTLLFKRPRWFYCDKNLEKQIPRGLAILEKAMTCKSGYLINEYSFLLRAVYGMARQGHDHKGSGRGTWPVIRMKRLLQYRQTAATEGYQGWGWKEPNSHLFLEGLNRYYSDFKYIHVIRHGLDMAFSSNQAQLFNWGKYFGVEIPRNPEDLEIAALDYWIKANKKATQLGEKLLDDRFLLVNFDKLCLEPKNEIKRILEFLKIESFSDNDLFEDLRQFKKPEYLGRYQKHDLSKFSIEKMDEVRNFGFQIEMTKQIS
jgi:hypothetical protein